MSTPRRPSAGRPPAGRRPARTGTRSTASRGRSQDAAATRRPGAPAGRAARLDGLRRRLSAGRIAVLVLVVVTLATSAALPVREFFEQRGEIAALQRSNAEASRRVAALEAERERLDDPAYIAAEARRRLHFVMPGETAYVVLPPSPAPGEVDADGSADDPWFSQLWGSVEQADRPAPAPTEPAEDVVGEPNGVPTVAPTPTP